MCVVYRQKNVQLRSVDMKELLNWKILTSKSEGSIKRVWRAFSAAALSLLCQGERTESRSQSSCTEYWEAGLRLSPQLQKGTFVEKRERRPQNRSVCCIRPWGSQHYRSLPLTQLLSLTYSVCPQKWRCKQVTLPRSPSALSFCTHGRANTESYSSQSISDRQLRSMYLRPKYSWSRPQLRTNKL